MDEELDRIKQFYRDQFLPQNAWTPLTPRAYLYQRQRQRRIRDALRECGVDTPDRMAELDVLDVGCGTGTNTTWLLELGANPSRCTAIDLVPESFAVAQRRLSGVRVLLGDFSTTDVGGPFDVVLLIAVLTSIVDPVLKRRVVDKCLSLLRPGGVFFFYDYMCTAEEPGSPNYKRISYDELDRYVGSHRMRWYKRDLLKSSLAERVVSRHGVVVAELLQALRIFNIEGSFGYVHV